MTDWATLAVTLESSITPLLISSKQLGDQLSPEEQQMHEERWCQDIFGRASEAIANFNKLNATFAATEMNFKIARYYVSINKKREASDLLMDEYEIVKEFPSAQKVLKTKKFFFFFFCLSPQNKRLMQLVLLLFCSNKWDLIENLLFLCGIVPCLIKKVEIFVLLLL